MTIFDFLLGIISTIRVSRILEVEKIATPIRTYFGIGHNTKGDPRTPTGLTGWRGFFGQLLWCFACITVWVGMFFSLLHVLNKKLYRLLSLGFSFSWLALEGNKLTNSVQDKIRL